MRKYSLKKLLPWVIVVGVLLVVAVVGFILMPIIDGMMTGKATGFDRLTYADFIIGGLQNLVSFTSKRSILAFIATVGTLCLVVAWFIFILVKKHYKKLIFWGIDLVAALVFCFIASLIFAGFQYQNDTISGYWILDIKDDNCQVGSILGLAIGFASCLGLIFFLVTIIIDLVTSCKPKEVKSEEEEINEAVQARLSEEKKAVAPAPVMAERKEEKVAYATVAQTSNVSEEHIRKIVHDECEILYLRLIKARAFNTEKDIYAESHKEEKVVIKEEHIARDESASDEEYYKRMISELGMFNGKKQKPAPVVEPVVKEVKKPAPAPAPVKKVAPVVAKPSAEKIVRIPFEKRIVSADKVMKDHFNELKSEILSYGVKSRVSNSGDTFRLHTVTFVKITIAGKSLKLYLALNPKDYKDSTLPIADASKKAIYKEIPLVFKVKSELSVRRAKQLIAEAMAKGGLKQGEVVAHDWVKEIKNGNF